ncbi:MAG: 2-phosphosulfolactate phosphatase [Candidatus Atribacteria bacterium]|nr:2-phosphosulfolactate phosphatase [Candidatus Atribacteria bacterium]
MICGRREKKFSGFNLGNSPREYNNKKVKDKIIIMTTTNGIRIIELMRRANRIIIGCFLNILEIVKYC